MSMKRPNNPLGPTTALAVIIMGSIALTLTGCGQRQLTGVVQNSKWVASGWELSLGNGETADYILVDRAALLDQQGRVAAAKDARNIILLGGQYIGMRIKVSGPVQCDSSGRRFIKVSRREQIEIL